MEGDVVGRSLWVGVEGTELSRETESRLNMAGNASAKHCKVPRDQIQNFRGTYIYQLRPDLADGAYTYSELVLLGERDDGGQDVSGIRRKR